MLYPTRFSRKGKIIDDSKHYILNLAIKQLQLQTGTGLLGLGNVWKQPGLGDVLKSWVPGALWLLPQDSRCLQHMNSEPASVVAQDQSQYSNAVMLWDVAELWRENESTSYHFSPLKSSKSSETKLWDRNTIRRHFSIPQLFFLQTMGFHKSVHEAVTTYIYIKISFAFIMQCARKQIERSLPVAPMFIPVSMYSPLEGCNLHNITQ